MILYTPYPIEQVLEGYEEIQAPEEINYNGIMMQVEMLSRSEARIVRLISPVPEHYLNASYAPGTIIKL